MRDIYTINNKYGMRDTGTGENMEIIITNSSSEPIYKQILEQVKNQIINGDLEENYPLPSIRKLAKDLQISVITTKRAYEELEKEGFICMIKGKGTFVAAQNKEFLKEKKMRIVEDKLNEAVTEAIVLGISLEELQEMLQLLYSYR